MNEKFVKYLEEGLQEKKDDLDLDKGDGDLDGDAPAKKKRGRPKADKDVDDDDKSGKEGVRDVKLTAKIKIGKKTETDEKILKDFDVSKIDAEIKKYEKALHKKYGYDADDITITKKIGDFEVEDKAEQHMSKTDDEGSDAEDDTYSLGRKEK